jgi:hypothetical protein
VHTHARTHARTWHAHACASVLTARTCLVWQANCAETVNSLNFASRAKTVALGKATKNREDIAEEKSGKASTVRA